MGIAARHRDVVSSPYCPDIGDLVWLDFDPVVATEQADRRPALILTPRPYNELTGRCLASPITSRQRGWSFELAVPPDMPISGVMLVDQLRTLSWRERGAKLIGKIPEQTLDEVRHHIAALIGL